MGNEIQCGQVMGKAKTKLPSNMFKVKNINEQGDVIWRGVVEVNRTELVLHQKIGDPIRWPLKSLRRYGSDKGLFSFESGRRCATGPGIYAFKCKHAEQLFQLVKTNTEEGAQEAQTSNQSQSDSQDGTHNRWMPPSHTQSMSGLFSQNGTIIRRQISSTTSGGATSPHSSVNGNGSASAPSIFNQVDDSPKIQYLNADQIQEVHHSQEQQSSNTSPPAIPPTSGTANRILNYAHLNLNPDEDALETMDGAPTEPPPLPPQRTPIQITDIDMVDSTMKNDSVSKKDENDNRTDFLVDGKKAQSFCVDVNTAVSSNCAMKDISKSKEFCNNQNKSKSIEVLPDSSELPYMNMNKDETTVEAQSRRKSVPLSPRRGKTTADNPLVLPGKSQMYSNLDTVAELLSHSSISGAVAGLPDVRTPLSSSSHGSPHSEFSFDWSPHTQSYANMNMIENPMRAKGAMPSCDPTQLALQLPPKGKLHYAQLDFEEKKCNRTYSSSSCGSPPQTPGSPSGDSPGKRTESYAVIDPNKTAALAISQRKISDGEISGRRTRHDAPPKKR